MTPELLDNPKQRQLEELDEEVESLKERLDEATASFPRALDEVSSRPEVDSSVQKRLSEVADRLKDLQPKMQGLGFDVEQQAALWGSILEVDRALNSNADDFDRFENILLGVERVRQVIRDALDEFTGGDDPDRTLMIHELQRRLPGVTQVKLAELLDVSPKTLRRWSQSHGTPSRRLALLTKTVRILHHAWTPDGIRAWLERPREALENKSPLEVIDNPAFEQSLIFEARGSRNQYAT